MRRRFIFFILLPTILLSLQAGCGSTTQTDNLAEEVAALRDAHVHGDADALHWPKKDVEHSGFEISLGHHGNHWHGGEQIEPAVAIVKGGEDIGDAKMTCQLFDGENAIESPVDMIFEPKTEAEPAHFAGAQLTFPTEEKKYLVKFEINLPGEEGSFSDTIEVTCGH